MKRTADSKPVTGNPASSVARLAALVIPETKERVLELAVQRGLLFGKSARNVATMYLDEVGRRYGDILAHEDEVEESELDKLLAKYNQAQSIWEAMQKVLLKAVEPLTKGDGEAARLARGAFADLLNVQETDRPPEALQAAFLAANAAARAYFVEHGKGDANKATRAKSKEERDFTSTILKSLGVEAVKKDEKVFFVYPERKVVRDRFAQELAARLGKAEADEADEAEASRLLRKLARWQQREIKKASKNTEKRV